MRPNTKNPNIRKAEQGFTLIELSIVLVIIGLIVGGVLVGQDLIKAAQIRATVTQLERYNTAANTFRGKYNGLPGDLLNGVNFFSAITAQSNSTASLGNGDGLIQASTGAATCANCVAGENAVFWYELFQAGYIPDAIGSAAINLTYTTAAGTVSSSVIPNAKVAGQVSVNSAGGVNYWVLATISGLDTAGVPATISNSLTPLQAYQMDTKIDDGAPDSGLVQSIATGTPGTLANAVATASVAATTCGDTTLHTYILTTDNTFNNANVVDCQLGIRTNF